MREVGVFERKDQAERFADHLLAMEVPAQVRDAREGHAVWVIPEDLLAKARAELEAFRADPDHERYRSVADKVKAVRKSEAKAEKAYRKNFRDLSGHWDRIGSARTPVTTILIVASVLVTLWARFGQDNLATSRFLLSLVIPLPEDPFPSGFLPEVASGQFWRLITPIFLHLGFLHLVFNMSCLHLFGTQIESTQGTRFLLPFVLATAIISNLAQYAVSGPYFGGMSGVVYGLFGYAWLRSRYEVASGMAVSDTTVLVMLGWLVAGYLGAIDGLVQVANTAHLAGLACGVFAAAVPYLRQRIFE